MMERNRLYSNNSVIYSTVYLFVCFFLLFIVSQFFEWKLAAYLTVASLIISILYLKLAYNVKIVSFSTIFLVCLWLFHCGQILNYGLKLDGTNYLYFINYGSNEVSYKAYIFYFIAQAIITLFIGGSSHKNGNGTGFLVETIPKSLPFFLFIIGIGPRLYYDFSYLQYGLLNGYHGFAVYIPQFVNTLAFFADMAVLIELLILGKKSRASVLFIVVLLYKGLMMMSGSRQEAFVFIIVLAYVFFFINRTVKVGKLLVYAVIAYFALSFIMAVGEARVGAFQSAGAFWDIFLKKASGGFLSDMFGEFGSAFTTLVKTVNDTPSRVTYGYGLTYVAGIASAVPTLVNRIPLLSDMTAYVVQYHGVSSFGGSVLGELYFNFGWFGLIAVPIVGKLVGRVNLSLEEMKDNKEITVRIVMSLMLAIALLLIVRGYFSDMAQKIIWMIITIKMANNIANRGGHRVD